MEDLNQFQSIFALLSLRITASPGAKILIILEPAKTFKSKSLFSPSFVVLLNILPVFLIQRNEHTIFELITENGFAEISLEKPADNLVINLPVRVEGLNHRWSAHLYQVEGYNGKEYYGNGRQKVRVLGIDRQGQAFLPVFVGNTPRIHIKAGHIIIADSAGKDLFIQLTADKADSNQTATSWHVSINNPTDQVIKTSLKQVIDVPGLNFTEITVSVSPGEYKVLK